MTLRTNARIAGSMFLLYIVAGMTSMVLFGRATRADGTAATLARIAQNATSVRVTILLTLLIFVIAVVLAVSLYALTRDQDRDLALMALSFRVSEGVIGAVSIVRTLGLLSIATASTAAAGADAVAAKALGEMLLEQGGWTGAIAAACFAFGSTLFCWLFLRARSIPVPLAWLGVIASLLLVVGLPLQLAALLRGPVLWLMWMPMLVFEVTLALWLLIKGVAVPAT